MLPEDLLDGRFQLVTPPELYLRIDALTASPRASAEEIAKVIAQDPALTARLLRIANSPLYGLTTPVETIGRAIAVVGTWELLDLVLSTSIVSAFSSLTGGRFDLTRFWRHSVLTATTARLLARQGPTPIERLFVAGLLHDIGLLILAQRFPDEAADWMSHGDTEGATHGDGLARIEDEVLGFDHALLARTMLAQWQIGEQILEPVACHHDAGRAIADPRASALLQIADMACAGASSSIPPDLFTLAGIAPAALETALATAAEQCDEVAGSLLD